MTDDGCSRAGRARCCTRGWQGSGHVAQQSPDAGLTGPFPAGSGCAQPRGASSNARRGLLIAAPEGQELGREEAELGCLAEESSAGVSACPPRGRSYDRGLPASTCGCLNPASLQQSGWETPERLGVGGGWSPAPQRPPCSSGTRQPAAAPRRLNLAGNGRRSPGISALACCQAANFRVSFKHSPSNRGRRRGLITY